MIPATEHRVVASSPVAEAASFGISRGDEAHLMTVLRDTLYSDKILAVLREYSANAWDAHREVGKSDVPIRVTLPTLESPTLEIRDYGPGLSRADVFGVFAMYGASTKRIDNKTVGMLGIGSKSGFAYGDSFAIESRHDGRCSTYVAIIDASERGEIRLLDECDAIDTGLAIRIAVRAQDVDEFRRKAVGLFAHMHPRPEVNAELPALAERVGHGALRDETGWTAVMGCVPYPIDLSQIGAATFVHNLGGVLYFDIGELHVSASRESLKYSDQTKRALRDRLNAFLDEYVRAQLASIESESVSPWDRRLRSQPLRRFDLSWLALNGDAAHSVELPDFAALSVRTRDGSRWTRAESIAVRRDARIVIRDDKRGIKGFRLDPLDYVASPAKGYTTAQAEGELTQFVASSIEGIPVARTSALSWTAPPRKPRSSGAIAPRGRAFVLSPSHRFGHPYSQHWSSVRRDATASDVYVILDAFRSKDFYEHYLEDQRVCAALNLEMPIVYGYKIGAAPFVGQTYAKWRETFAAETVRLPQVQDLLAQHRAHGLSGNGPSKESIARIEDRIGAAHPIARLCLRVRDAHEMSYDVKSALRVLLARCPQKEGNVDAKILQRHPLLAAEGVDKLWGDNTAAWLSYVAGKKRTK